MYSISLAWIDSSLLADFLNILVEDLCLNVLSEDTGEATVLATAESGFLEGIINEDLNCEIFVCGLSQVVLDDNSGWRRQGERWGIAAYNTLRNKLKHTLIGPEHEVLGVFSASSAFETRFTVLFLADRSLLTRFDLEVLNPLECLVL